MASYFECAKCGTRYDDPNPAKDYPGGIFCPECRKRGGVMTGVCHRVHQPEPTIPLTQVEAMLREAVEYGFLKGTADDSVSFEPDGEWIANKIKEARGG